MSTISPALLEGGIDMHDEKSVQKTRKLRALIIRYYGAGRSFGLHLWTTNHSHINRHMYVGVA